MSQGNHFFPKYFHAVFESFTEIKIILPEFELNEVKKLAGRTITVTLSAFCISKSYIKIKINRIRLAQVLVRGD